MWEKSSKKVPKIHKIQIMNEIISDGLCIPKIIEHLSRHPSAMTNHENDSKQKTIPGHFSISWLFSEFHYSTINHIISISL